MRVVVDSHVLIFYLFTPDRLSEPALEALGEALAPGAFESLRRTVLDPTTNFDVVPITVGTMDCFARVPLVELADPFDRFILATAAQLHLPFVTADRAMSRAVVAVTETGKVELASLTFPHSVRRSLRL